MEERLSLNILDLFLQREIFTFEEMRPLANNPDATGRLPQHGRLRPAGLRPAGRQALGLRLRRWVWCRNFFRRWTRLSGMTCHAISLT